MESQVAVESTVLSTCSEADALGATDAFFGDPARWEPSLIAYRLRSDFQADWKAEVGRWLLAAKDLGYVAQLEKKLERAFKDLRNPNRVSGANDSSHLILGQELAVAMTAYYFTRMGWKFIAWEPKLPDGVKGDVDLRLQCPHGILTDVQIKANDQPGERDDGQVVGGEYDERVLKGVDKGVKQLARVPGPQRMLVLSPQRLWADAEGVLASHLFGSTVNREGVVTLRASDRGIFASAQGVAIGAVVHLHLVRGVEQRLYRCTAFLNPWAPESARPRASAFRNTRTCQLVGDGFLWTPEMSNHCHVLPSGTRYLG